MVMDCNVNFVDGEGFELFALADYCSALPVAAPFLHLQYCTNSVFIYRISWR